MSLNKQKIIPLIESYYHTFTPLERTIADFFMNNTEEEDLSSRHISGILYVSEASLSRFAQKCGFHGYREFIYEYKQSLIPETEENVPNFEISEFNTYQELLNKAMPCWIKPRLHISPDFWFPNHGCMSTEEAVPGLWLRK